jgi:hypothetical protein
MRQEWQMHYEAMLEWRDMLVPQRGWQVEALWLRG